MAQPRTKGGALGATLRKLRNRDQVNDAENQVGGVELADLSITQTTTPAINVQIPSGNISIGSHIGNSSNDITPPLPTHIRSSNIGQNLSPSISIRSRFRKNITEFRTVPSRIENIGSGALRSSGSITPVNGTDTEPFPPAFPFPSRGNSPSPSTFERDFIAAYQYHPNKWPMFRRVGIASFYCLLSVFVNIVTTAWVASVPYIEKEYGTSAYKAFLGQSLYILGNALGPYFFAPIADLKGRKLVFVPSMILFALFNVGLTFSPGLNARLVLMFFAGAAGATPIYLTAAVLVDLFASPRMNSQAMAGFVVASNVGPSIGSTLGELLLENHQFGFRWIFIFNAIIAIALATVNHFFLPETHTWGVMRGARSQVEDENVRALMDYEKFRLRDHKKWACTIVGRIIWEETTIMFLAIVNGFAYGVMFLFLQTAPKVFGDNPKFTPLDVDLTYLSFTASVLVFFVTWQIFSAFIDRYRKSLGFFQGTYEATLVVAAVVVWLFPAAILIYGFTATSKSAWAPILAGAFFGFANPVMWNCMLVYVTEIYASNAGSAVAAFQIPSFIITAAMPQLGVFMFGHLSIKVGCIILASCSVVVAAIVGFVWYAGEGIRNRSQIAYAEKRYALAMGIPQVCDCPPNSRCRCESPAVVAGQALSTQNLNEEERGRRRQRTYREEQGNGEPSSNVEQSGDTGKHTNEDHGNEDRSDNTKQPAKDEQASLEKISTTTKDQLNEQELDNEEQLPKEKVTGDEQALENNFHMIIQDSNVGVPKDDQFGDIYDASPPRQRHRISSITEDDLEGSDSDDDDDEALVENDGTNTNPYWIVDQAKLVPIGPCSNAKLVFNKGGADMVPLTVEERKEESGVISPEPVTSARQHTRINRTCFFPREELYDNEFDARRFR